MSGRRPIKLLNKTTAFYLIFSFLVFFISAFIMSKMANQYIDSYVQNRFSKFDWRLKKHLTKDSTLSRLPRYLKLRRLSDRQLLQKLPVVKDTIIYNESIDEYQHYRKRLAAIKVGKDYYVYETRVHVGDFYRLRDDFLASMFFVFGALALGLIAFNYFLSGYLFRPFYQILNVMKTYKVGQQTSSPAISTTTEEFIKMQKLFQKMLDQIEKDYRNLKEYTEDMAHEIQTPLAIIRNKLETLMRDEAALERHGEAIQVIYRQINHLSHLGNVLNLITRIENGEFKNTRIIRTKPIIEEHLQPVKELAELKGLKITLDLNEEHAFNIDPYLFELVLKNLVRNAIQHAPTGASITIKTDEQSLIISNVGAELDFPPQQLFKRFVKRKNNGETLGLGLALVKKICDLNELNVSYEYLNGRHVFKISKAA
ncbi:sensor histidine kinase [Caldithrix abyssi]